VRTSRRSPIPAWLGALGSLAGDVRRAIAGHDVWLAAGGLTFYAGIAVIPLMLLGLFLAGLLVGQETARDLALELAGYAPEGLGLSDGLEELAEVGPRLGLLAAAVAVVPASSYGEGLVRAFDRLGGRPRAQRRALRGRLKSLALVAALPGVVLVGLLSAATVPGRLGDGTSATVLGVYLAFWIGWIASSLLLLLLYRAFVPEPLGARALFWGCTATGSFLTGMSLAWVAIVGADLDVGRAYGGSEAVGAAVLGAIYLFAVQLVVLIGYVLTLQLAARGGHPLRRRDDEQSDGEEPDGEEPDGEGSQARFAERG
jgi:membrane protein